jgi:putative signal transducing protein
VIDESSAAASNVVRTGRRVFVLGSLHCVPLDEFVAIATFPFLPEAELAASVLRAAGIECFVRDQYVGGVRPELIFTGQGFRLLVGSADEDRARQLLDSRSIPSTSPKTY